MKQIVFGVTGSIASYKSCDLVSALAKDKNTLVHVVMTSEATRFVSPLTFQTLSGRRVYSDLFEAPEQWDLLHTSLSQEADLIVVCPATLNLISKVAGGICDDLLTCVLFASKAPVIVVPAMNPNMYGHPVTQENIAKLKRIGYEFVGPVHGQVACRQVGMGHIAGNDQILSAIKRRLSSGKKGKK